MPLDPDTFDGEAACRELAERHPFEIRFPLCTPPNVTLFVNAACNAFCEHCFIIHDRPQAQDKSQLPLETILRIFDSCTNQTAVMLTGGEPFLRMDLGELSSALLERPQIASLAMNSNGSFPARIESLLDHVCGTTHKPIHLQLSLDGLAEKNDEVRQIARGYEKVIDTCERCGDLQVRHPNFSFVVHITLMKQNADEVELLVDELERLNLPSKISLARGNDFSTFDVPPGLLEPAYKANEDVQLLPEEVRAVIDRIRQKHPHYFDDFQQIKLETMLGVLEHKERQLPCYAGYVDGVIYPNGDVLICEQVKPFGNLSEWDWNLSDAWNSPQAMEHRRQLSSCSCIHGCNISTSVSIEYFQ